MADKKRLQLEFEEEAYKKLELLQEKLGATSKSEVIRRALQLLEYALASKGEGGKVIVKTKKGEEFVLLA